MEADAEPDSALNALGSVFESISVNFLSVLTAKVIGFSTTLLLTNWLTESEYGIYVYVLTIIGIVGTVAQLGTKQSLMKFLPTYDEASRRNETFGIALTVVVVANLLSCGVLFVLAPTIAVVVNEGARFVTILRIFAFILFFQAARPAISSGFLALEYPKYGITIERVLSPLFRLGAVGVAIALGLELIGISVSILVATGLLVLPTAILLVRVTGLRPSTDYSMANVREYFEYAGTLLVRTIGMMLYTKVDIIILGILALSADVAIYRVAWILAVIIDIPLNGVRQVFPSIVSRLHDAGRRSDLSRVFKTVTKWTFTLSLPLFVGGVVFRYELLHLFGETYAQEGAQVFVIVALAQLVSNALGPQGMILLMTGYERLNTVHVWVFGVLNVVLNLSLIPRYGILGAAIAMAVGFILLEVVVMAEVWYLREYVAFSWGMVRPLPAGVVAGIVMFGLRTVVPGPMVAGLLVGGALGTLVYLGCVVAFVVDDTDIEVLRTLRS